MYVVVPLARGGVKRNEAVETGKRWEEAMAAAAWMEEVVAASVQLDLEKKNRAERCGFRK